MNFRKLLVTDKDVIKTIVGEQHDFLGWEYDFNDIFLWDVYEVSQIHTGVDCCIIYTVVDAKDIFFPPYLKRQSDFLKAITAIHNYAASNGMDSYTIIGLTKEQACQMDSGRYYVTTDIGSYDYIYSAENLISLSGKKFHGKRNLVNKFVSNYAFEIADYTAADREEIMRVFDEWKSLHDDEANATLLKERQAVKRALDHFNELDLKICEIKIDGKIEAFSICSLYNGKIGHTIFEKANVKFDGIFQAINKFTAQRYFQGCLYINREEDMNIEGLRRAKKSYNPIMLWEKFNAFCNI